MSPNETLSKALGTFLLERLLSNQQITEAYARPNTTGGFQEGGIDGRVGEKEEGWERREGRGEGGRVGEGKKLLKDVLTRVWLNCFILLLVHHCS